MATAVRLALVLSLLVAGAWAHGHDHDHHDHDDYGHEHDHHGHAHDQPASFKYSRAANERPAEKVRVPELPAAEPEQDVWMLAMASTALISLAPYLILYFVPVDGSAEKKPLLKVLLAFASGGLLGDAFLHLIPHAIAPHDHDHSHSHSHGAQETGHHHDMSVGLGVLAGILTFLIIEKFVRILSSGHGHSHGPPKKVKSKEKESKKSEIKIAGYLNLAADFAHNFTDGLAIGASYIAGNTVGIVTTLTILFHEVPHEIGDFAILVQSGCSRRKAMTLQLLTAVGAFAGTALSLSLRDNFDAVTTCILPFTAGGFIYIATVSIIPELLEDSTTKYVQSLKEILALLAGVGMMVLIAQYE